MTVRVQSFKATLQREGDGVRLSVRTAYQGENRSWSHSSSDPYETVQEALEDLRNEVGWVEETENEADFEDDLPAADREPTDEELEAIEDGCNADDCEYDNPDDDYVDF